MLTNMVSHGDTKSRAASPDLRYDGNPGETLIFGGVKK